jgi:hypothetical protein
MILAALTANQKTKQLFPTSPHKSSPFKAAFCQFFTLFPHGTIID